MAHNPVMLKLFYVVLKCKGWSGTKGSQVVFVDILEHIRKSRL